MTCDSALEKLLDADPSEFSAGLTTPLGQHLRDCARCRRVAAQLHADTRLLATALTSARVRQPVGRVRRVSLAPALVVAALVFAMIPRSRQVDVPVAVSMDAPRLPAATVVEVSPQPNGPVTGEVDQPTRGGELRAYPRAAPVVPVRFARSEPPAPVVVSSAVTVDPPPGKRATVMHTSNPKLVVVWLY